MTILRAALYPRVSTEEQAIRGFSIDTQIDNLKEHCQKRNMKVVDIYSDEGVSGAKPAFKRPEMARLLEDVKNGKIDIILFTKLDRWFRNVKEYFKVQEILDAHGVEWKAIHEDYDTTTANGRMAITIFLAIAQNEREKTAERIKIVFENKRKNKEACFGGKTPPFGYMKAKNENGTSRLVKNPEQAPMVEDFWNILIKYNNLNKAIRHMHNVYGVSKNQKTWKRIARSEFYCGMYCGIDDYCEPYVTKEDWLMVQERAKERIHATQKNRIYLYSGMMRCPECNHVLCGTYTNKVYNGAKYEYRGYRCRFKYTTCSYNRTISEKKIEKHLLRNVREYLQNEIATAEIENAKPKPKPKHNIPALKERLRRLNVTYMAGNISDEEYLRDDAEIKALIAKAEQDEPQKERDVTPLKELLETDFETVYATLDREEKRKFWRDIIKEIKVADNAVADVVFF